MIKYLSTAVVAASFALAGCNTMSGMQDDLKKGGEKLGIGGKDKTEQTMPAADPAPMPGDAGTMVDPNTGMPADAGQGTSMEGHGMDGHDAHTGHMGHEPAAQPAESESMMDKAKNKAKEWMK
ncbi:MAG: hypothetical protein Q4D91_02675 [Lautropia sp.]|nr:hypothetical protein [Lautropia sp.]